MRKIGFGFLGLVLVGIIYYFTLGKTQLITEVKQQVSSELTLLQKEGFSVDNRKVQERQEYFELSLNDTQKALAFFNTHGVAMSANDIKALEGSKLGIGLQYLPDSYTSVAMDITPLTLPTKLTQNADASQKKSLEALQKLLDKKALQVHIAMNKLGNGFKGYLKDIDETIETQEKAHLTLHALSFEGTLEKGRLHSFTQKLQDLTLSISQEFNTTLTDLVNTYENSGKGYKNSYTFASLKLSADHNNIEIKDVTMESISSIENKLASIEVINQSNQIEVLVKNKHYLLDDVNFTSLAKNLDISAFEKLQTIDPENKEEINKVITQLLSKGVAFSIPTLSVGHLTLEKERLEGFDINAHFNIDKNIPIATLQNNPMGTLPYIDANLKIALSPSLMSYIIKDPKAMLAMMMFQPKNINGKKVYQVEIKDGKALLNGKPIF